MLFENGRVGRNAGTRLAIFSRLITDLLLHPSMQFSFLEGLHEEALRNRVYR